MKKKISKERELRDVVAAHELRIRSLTKANAELEAVLDRIQKAVGDNVRYGRSPDLLSKVYELVSISRFYEGRIPEGHDQIQSLERVIRWIVNPECARDDEKIARFEEERKQRGF